MLQFAELESWLLSNKVIVAGLKLGQVATPSFQSSPWGRWVLVYWWSDEQAGRAWIQSNAYLAANGEIWVLMSRDLLVKGRIQVEQLCASPVAVVQVLMLVAQPEEHCSNPVATKRMLRLDEPLSPVRAGSAPTPQMRRTIWLICDFMSSSESKNTPRSRTTEVGDVMSDPTRMSLSTYEIFLRVCCIPNHITSVFLVFSWRRFDVHQLFTDMYHSSFKPSSDVSNVRRRDHGRADWNWRDQNLMLTTRCWTPNYLRLGSILLQAINLL